MLRGLRRLQHLLRGNQPSGVAVSHHHRHLHQRSAPRPTPPKRVPHRPHHRPATSRPGWTLVARATIGRSRCTGCVARHPTRRRVGDIASAIPAGCLLSRYRRTPVPRDRRNHGVLRRLRLVTSAPRAPTIYEPCCEPHTDGHEYQYDGDYAGSVPMWSILLAVGLAVVIAVLRPARTQRPTPIVTRKILLRAVVLLASWAIRLLVAAWTVPRVSLSVPGFVVAIAVFAVTQAILSLSILKLPHRYASLLLGGTGLALTIVALILGSVLTHGLTIDGTASWLATTVVVWLVTTIGARYSCPSCSSATGRARPDQRHAGAKGCTSVVRV